MSKIWNRAITVGDYFKVCGVIVGIYMIFLGGLWLDNRKWCKQFKNEFAENLPKE